MFAGRIHGDVAMSIALRVDQLARARTGVASDHRSIPAPALGTAVVDEQPQDVPDFAWAYLFELVLDLCVGGNHAHAGTGAFDLATRDRKLIHVPVVEAA
jgi:hypothetical protein